MKPLRGRAFESISPSELMASPSVLISENYWQKRFAGDSAVLGKSIRLNDAVFTIIGITPHDFVGTSVAVPDCEHLSCRLFSRLASGINMAQAQEEQTDRA